MEHNRKFKIGDEEEDKTFYQRDIEEKEEKHH
jgi:hypothetical protein